jgi:hypothetical protein
LVETDEGLDAGLFDRVFDAVYSVEVIAYILGDENYTLVSKVQEGCQRFAGGDLGMETEKVGSKN